MYIYGASGHARVIIDLVDSYEPIQGIFDDNPEIKEILGYPVRGKIPIGFEFDKAFMVAIGNNKIRKEIVDSLMRRAEFATVIHDSALVSKRAFIGAGTAIMEGAIVKVCCKIGRHVIVNTGASLDHDCIIGDYVHLAPQSTLCGGISIGEGTLVGANALVLPGIRIGAWCTIGGGSVVSRDVPDGVIWVGTELRG